MFGIDGSAPDAKDGSKGDDTPQEFPPDQTTKNPKAGKGLYAFPRYKKIRILGLVGERTA